MRQLPAELVAYFVLLFAMPAHLVLPGFGAAGAPASLVGLVMLALLVIGWMAPQLADAPTTPVRGLNPVVVALGFYVVMLVASWTSGKLRPLSALASTTSDRALISVASLVGTALFVLARVRSKESVLGVVDWMLYGATFMSAIGLVQFFTGVDASSYLRAPGLVSLRETTGLDTRSIFNRPFGTALHPIEFGVVSASLVPLAWWRVRHGARGHWLVLGIIALGSMTSLSRSAMLALAIGSAVIFVTSSWLERVVLTLTGCVLVVGAGAAVPGLVGTIRAMFQQAEDDPSVQARIDRTPEVLRLISEHLWFGRGFGTFTPEEYLLLDNEIQKMAIESGLVGVGVFVVFIVTVLWAAATVERHLSGTSLEKLGVALSGSILGIAVSYYTFDAFFYHILTGVMFVNVALVGVLWNMSQSSSGGSPRSAQWHSAASAEATPVGPLDEREMRRSA